MTFTPQPFSTIKDSDPSSPGWAAERRYLLRK